MMFEVAAFTLSRNRVTDRKFVLNFQLTGEHIPREKTIRTLIGDVCEDYYDVTPSVKYVKQGHAVDISVGLEGQNARALADNILEVFENAAEDIRPTNPVEVSYLNALRRLRAYN